MVKELLKGKVKRMYNSAKTPVWGLHLIDVQSAVEWLKELFEDNERYNAEYVKDRIDEAFPDLLEIKKKEN